MQVPDVLKNKWIQIGSVAVVSLAAGSFGGYILGKRKGVKLASWTIADVLRPTTKQLKLFDQANTEKRYSEVDFEVRPEERLLKAVMDKEPDPDLEKLLDEEEAILRERGKALVDDLITKKPYVLTTNDEPKVEEPERINIFRQPDEDWDYEAEMSTRRQDEPYILHADEYISDELDLHQETMTYYEGDDIMADMHDTILYNHAGLMGDLNFGHGSKDPNVVYIRNEAEGREWEVLRHTGSYQIEVKGMHAEEEIDEEIRHAGPLKFRRE